MDGLGLTFVYSLLGGATLLAWVAWRRGRTASAAQGPRLRRHAYGLRRELEVAGKRLQVRGDQEPTSLAVWHVEIRGPFPRALSITRRSEPPRGGEELDAGERIGGIGRWQVNGPAESVATLLDAKTRAVLDKLGGPFELRDGKVVGTLEVRDPGGLKEIPAEALALAHLVLEAPTGFARLVAATEEADPLVRALALDALVAGHRARPECQSALEAARQDRDARVRVRAWLATGDRERALAELRDAGAVEDGGATQMALHALLGARLGDAALAPLWREATYGLRAGAALQRWVVAGVGNGVPAVVAALGGPEEAERRLCDMLEARSHEVGKAALGALVRVGTAACVPHIQAVRGRLGDQLVKDALLSLQARLGKGGELALVDTANVGALSEVEDGR